MAKYKKKIMVSSNYMICLLCWGIIFLPPVFLNFSSLLVHMINGLGFTLFFLLFVLNMKSVTIGRNIWLMLWFVVWCVGITLLKTPGKVVSLVYNSVLPILEIFFLFQYSIKSKKRSGLRALSNICKFYIIINFLSMLFFPHGMVQSSVGSSVVRAQWFYSSKNNVALYMIVFITVVIWYDYSYKKNKKKNWVYVLMAVFSVVMCGEKGVGFLEGSSTGMLAVFVTLFLIYYYRFVIRLDLTGVSKKFLMIGTGAAYFIVLSGGIIPVVQNFIVNILHKTVTYSGRSYIWQTTMSHILKSIWIGHGETDFYSSVYIENQLTYTTYTYNAVLKIVLNYGLIGLGLLLVFLAAMRNLNMYQDKLLFSGFLGLMVIGLMNELDIKWIVFFPILICCLANAEVKNSAAGAKKKYQLSS